MDFKLMKELIKSTIIEKYDYKIFNKATFGKIPTIENMVDDIFWIIRSQTFLIKRVRLWKNDKCYAEIGY